MTAFSTADSLPDDHILVFIGHASDADGEASAIYDLEQNVRSQLQRMAAVIRDAGGQPARSHIEFYRWTEDAKPLKGGQDGVIQPWICRADVAVFVFKGRVGEITWQELNDLRRPDSRARSVIAVFPQAAPETVLDLEGASHWVDLLRKKQELRSGWGAEGSSALLPVDDYRGREHLMQLVQGHLIGVLPTFLRKTEPAAATQAVTHGKSALKAPIPFVEQMLDVIEYDSHAVGNYRKRLRPAEQLRLPESLSDGSFLDQGHYRVTGRLNRAATLLFTRQPDIHTPGAALQCERYLGIDKSAKREREVFRGPVFEQISGAVNFLLARIERAEGPQGTSAASETKYRYPTKALREVIANAVCHKTYESHGMCHVRLFADRIEVSNPGAWIGKDLPADGTARPLAAFRGQSLSVNYRLSMAIAAIDLMEMAGSGISTAVKDCTETGAPMPEVRFEDGCIVVTVFPGRPFSVEATDWSIQRLMNDGILDELTKVFVERSAAISLLENAGYPRAHIPDVMLEPTEFWRDACQQIVSGRMVGGIPALLAEAARQFPGNHVFNAWANGARTGPGTSGTPAQEASISIYGAADPLAVLDAASQLADGLRVSLAYANADVVTLLLQGGDSAQATELLSALRQQFGLQAELQTSSFRPYLFSRLYLEGPDQSRFELNNVPAATRVMDIAKAGITEYDETTWPRDRQGMQRQAVLDHVAQDGSTHRLELLRTLHGAGVRDGDTLHMAPESTSGCFPAGTTVALANGTRAPIECITPQQSVRLGMPSADGRRTSRVLAVERRIVTGLIRVNGGVRTSASQPLYVNGVDLQARHLRLGDTLLNGEGREHVVERLEQDDGQFEVFNLVLEGAQDTFIADEVVVFHMHARRRHSIPTDAHEREPDDVYMKDLDSDRVLPKVS